MAFETIKGIVLRYTDYRDNDRILSLLVRGRGLISVTARACRKQGSKLAAACELYCYGEYVVYEREKVTYVSSASVLEAFYPIREDYDKFESAAQVAHITWLLAYNTSGPSDELYDLCWHAMSFIAYGEQEPMDIELCFAAKVLKLAGYGPVLTHCAACGRDLRHETKLYFSKTQGGAMCGGCGSDSRQVSALALEAFRRMIRIPLESMGRVKLPENVRSELNALIYEYAEYVFEQTIRLRSRT